MVRLKCAEEVPEGVDKVVVFVAQMLINKPGCSNRAL